MAVRYRLLEKHPGYCVGSDGSVWSCRPANGRGALKTIWRRITPRWTKRGYGQVLIYANGSRVMRLVHHLVLEGFVGPRPSGMQACHRDGNSRNNRCSNLRWDTPKANAADRDRHGRTGKGEKNGSAKLSLADVQRIRSMKGRRYVEIAREFGVTPEAVSLVARGITWN